MSNSVNKLFRSRKPYNVERSYPYFFNAIKESTNRFIQESQYYSDICEMNNFSLDELKTMEDLHKIPIIPTLFLKRNDISIKTKSAMTVTSSGTGKKVSVIGFTLGEILKMFRMSITLGLAHNLFSPIPTRYFILGYEPNKNNKRIISKTAYLSSWYAPGFKRTYALKYNNGDYELDLDGIFEGLIKASKGICPVRILGFPAYTYFLLEKMKQEGATMKLPKGSRILLGGGWKQFAGEEVSKENLYQLAEDVLGIRDSHIHEFFSAAEHPVLYCSCKNHNFHVPVYGKVIIRDVNTLAPLPKGEIGLINLLTPLGSNLPLMSIMTDDIGILHKGAGCGCGIETDYLEILGRVGVADIKTCAQGANDYWREQSDATNKRESL